MEPLKEKSQTSLNKSASVVLGSALNDHVGKKNPAHQTCPTAFEVFKVTFHHIDFSSYHSSQQLKPAAVHLMQTLFRFVPVWEEMASPLLVLSRSESFTPSGESGYNKKKRQRDTVS